MGTTSQALGIPFDINFIQTEDDYIDERNYTAPAHVATPCHRAPSSLTSACSCQDCEAVCTSSAPFPSLADGGCKIATMECLVAMSMLAFGGLCFAVMFMIVLHFVLRSADRDGTDDDSDLSDYKTAAGGTILSERDVTRIENVGAWLEHRLEAACSQYGQFCTQHPLFVFVVGLAVALVCSCGLIKVRFTTDPVELWSSPGSRARIEKQYFDDNFA
jgi:Niemann-Pick C1 protein